MNKLLALAAGVFLSALLIVSGYAQTAADSGAKPKSTQSSPKKHVSKRSKAKQEVQEKKKAMQKSASDEAKQQ